MRDAAKSKLKASRKVRCEDVADDADDESTLPNLRTQEFRDAPTDSTTTRPATPNLSPVHSPMKDGEDSDTDEGTDLPAFDDPNVIIVASQTPVKCAPAPKAPKAKRKHGNNHKRDSERYSPKKRQRTKDDFFTFCNIVLEYTQYDTLKQEELRRCNNTSPLDSTGSTADSFTSESTSSSISESEHDDKPLDATPRMVSSMLGHDEDSNSGFTTSPKVERVERDEELDNSRDSLHDHIRNSGVESDDSAMERPSDESGDDSWELVTCYCMKPFSGRPMIECSECLTWIHLSCAKIRKSNIPDDFVCQKCRESKFTMRKSSRIRSEKKMINA